MLGFDKYDGLTDCQKTALTAMLDGRNVFLTGDAGTGKSFVLQRYLDHAKRNIIACAPTGIAALKLRGGRFIAPFIYPTGKFTITAKPCIHQRRF